MQRQSLGGGSSPGSKHHHNINGGVSSSKEVSRLFDDDEEEESKEETTPTRKEKRGGVLVVVSEIEEEEEVEKKKKKKKTEKHRHHHLRSISLISTTRTEKSIHLIPILTIFCLLILYLCSYDPPLKDLAHIDGFRRISKRIDDSTTEINGGLAGRFSSDQLDDDVQNNKAVVDVLLPMIRSHRSLHEIRKDDGRRKSIHRFHRKIGDYSTSTHT